MREFSCTECVDLCAEVALGIADAKERADVLVHVEHCPACRSELRTLGDVADALVELVPPVVPPKGFEARAVSALAGAAQSHGAAARRPGWSEHRLRRVFAAAAVVVAAAIGVGGWALGQSTSTTTGGVATAQLRSGHDVVGELTVVTSGERPWVSMAVHMKLGASVVRCEVRSTHGPWKAVGTFKIVGGYGYWAAPLPWGLSVRSAELVTGSGRVLASAIVGTA